MSLIPGLKLGVNWRSDPGPWRSFVTNNDEMYFLQYSDNSEKFRMVVNDSGLLQHLTWNEGYEPRSINDWNQNDGSDGTHGSKQLPDFGALRFLGPEAAASSGSPQVWACLQLRGELLRTMRGTKSISDFLDRRATQAGFTSSGKELCKGIHPDEAIEQGAAVQAAVLNSSNFSGKLQNSLFWM
ncbi:hypothetical protein ACLB2K_058547 [Fragaria x ananassa]